MKISIILVLATALVASCFSFHDRNQLQINCLSCIERGNIFVRGSFQNDPRSYRCITNPRLLGDRFLVIKRACFTLDCFCIHHNSSKYLNLTTLCTAKDQDSCLWSEESPAKGNIPEQETTPEIETAENGNSTAGEPILPDCKSPSSRLVSFLWTLSVMMIPGFY